MFQGLLAIGQISKILPKDDFLKLSIYNIVKICNFPLGDYFYISNKKYRKICLHVDLNLYVNE